MRLIVLHRIFIVSAMALCAVFAVRSLVLFARGGRTVDLAIAGGAVAIGLALGVYLSRLHKQTT